MNNQMTIKCSDKFEFVEIIAALVKQGLTFEARADSYLIILTGGY